MKEIEIVIRPYDPQTDDAYIYSTWTRYSWYSPKEKITLSKGEFFKNKAEEIKKILDQGDIKTACIKDEPSLIAGYIALDQGKLAWLCVKKDYHNQGIEELLKKSMKGRIDE